MSAAASIAVQTLAENRAVGLTVSSRRQQILTPDRGTRVEQKILHLLANVQADGTPAGGRGAAQHAAAAAARHDAVHHHRLHGP